MRVWQRWMVRQASGVGEHCSLYADSASRVGKPNAATQDQQLPSARRILLAIPAPMSLVSHSTYLAVRPISAAEPPPPFRHQHTSKPAGLPALGGMHGLLLLAAPETPVLTPGNPYPSRSACLH